MKVLCIFVGLVVVIEAGYHEEIGIPLAARIKAAEDKIAKVPDMESRVVGGKIAPVGAHPYLVGLIVRLKSGLTSACGSSLVSTTRLLTAAHCMEGAKSVEAVFGSQYIFHGGTRITSNKFATHPRFDLSRSTDFDIAVVYLPRAVKFSATIKPINLPTKNDVEVVGELAMAAGWGKTSDRQISIPDKSQLSQVRLKIVPEALCQKRYGSTRVSGNMICTSGAGGVGTCDGDSGGPLVVERKGRKVLVGLTSFGDDKCEAGEPSAFTRVASFLGFIRKHL